MHGFTISQDDDAEEPIIHFRHLHPTPDATVRLERFPKRSSRDGNDMLPGQIGSVAECGMNVLWPQRWILIENALRCLACCKIIENN